jgi:hypothetical protein
VRDQYQFLTRIISNQVTPVTSADSEIKPVRLLDNANIVSLDMLNWYSGLHPGY